VPKKSLILYSSLSGNTEKVALRFKKVFVDQGWECDTFKIDKNTDYREPPFNIEDYDFLCAGSYVLLELPAEEIVNFMCKNPLSGHCGQPTREELARQRLLRNNPNYLPPAEKPKREIKTHNIGKIKLGEKKGIVFATYGGMHLGPKEAAPALALLQSEVEHLGFECIGQFSCPGTMRGHGPAPEDAKRNPPPQPEAGQKPNTYHKDMSHRPNERDLLRAEFFLEDKLEEITE